MTVMSEDRKHENCHFHTIGIKQKNVKRQGFYFIIFPTPLLCVRLLLIFAVYSRPDVSCCGRNYYYIYSVYCKIQTHDLLNASLLR